LLGWKKKMLIQTSYFICATPRTGSFLLCEALKNTGVAGQPAEYFARDDKSPLQENWSPSVGRKCLEEDIEQGSTANGVFGAKIMRGYFDILVGKLRLILGAEELSVPELLQVAFPNLHYI